MNTKHSDRTAEELLNSLWQNSSRLVRAATESIILLYAKGPDDKSPLFESTCIYVSICGELFLLTASHSIRNTDGKSLWINLGKILIPLNKNARIVFTLPQFGSSSDFDFVDIAIAAPSEDLIKILNEHKRPTALHDEFLAPYIEFEYFIIAGIAASKLKKVGPQKYKTEIVVVPGKRIHHDEFNKLSLPISCCPFHLNEKMYISHRKRGVPKLRGMSGGPLFGVNPIIADGQLHWKSTLIGIFFQHMQYENILLGGALPLGISLPRYDS